MTVSTIEVNGNQKQRSEEFQVYMELKSTISVYHRAFSHEEAEDWANIKFDPEAIQQALITLIKSNGAVIQPGVHDVDLKVTAVFGEDES